METLVLTIDESVIERYSEHYFCIHPKAKKKPIQRPYHESINVWMIMKRPMMNSLKQKWKEFIKWFIRDQGYSNLRIEKCEITQRVFYPNNRKHDVDNSVPKFIIDGFVEGGMIVGDDSSHVIRLILECGTDVINPRTELEFTIYEMDNKE